MQKAGIGENPISAYICFGYKIGAFREIPINLWGKSSV